MTRPTKEQVDEAMELDSLKYEAVLDAYNVLRAEVRALKEQLYEGTQLKLAKELAETRNEIIRRLSAIVTRVEALPAKWRDDYKLPWTYRDTDVVSEMIEGLEAALKGEP